MDTSTIYEMLAMICWVLGILMSILTAFACVKYKVVKVVKGLLFISNNTPRRYTPSPNTGAWAVTARQRTKEMSVQDVTQPLMRETQVLESENEFTIIFEFVETHTEEKIKE